MTQCGHIYGVYFMPNCVLQFWSLLARFKILREQTRIGVREKYLMIYILGGKVVVVVLGDNETGVTFLPGLGAFVAFGLAGLLVSRVVRAGGVGAVHAGVITGRIILSVVRGVVLLLVGPGMVK